MPKPFQRAELPTLLLRIGLAFVFAYAGISALRFPEAWIGFVPGIVTHFVGAKVFLTLISILQLLLAGALLIGKYVRYAAILATLFLLGLTLFNLSSLIVTFRDVGLICMAAALFFMEDK